MTTSPHDYQLWRDGFAAGYERAAGELTPDVEFLDELIRLTHPDRHPGREVTANRVTARLTELRRRAAANRAAGRAATTSG